MVNQKMILINGLLNKQKNLHFGQDLNSLMFMDLMKTIKEEWQV